MIMRVHFRLLFCNTIYHIHMIMMYYSSLAIGIAHAAVNTHRHPHEYGYAHCLFIFLMSICCDNVNANVVYYISIIQSFEFASKFASLVSRY